jgi:hypothetical protein
LKRFPDFGLVEIPNKTFGEEYSSKKRSENVEKGNMRGDTVTDKNRGSERGSDVNRTVSIDTEQKQVEGKVERDVRRKVEGKGKGKGKDKAKSAARRTLKQDQESKADRLSHSKVTHTLRDREGERRLGGRMEGGEEARERVSEGEGGRGRRHSRRTLTDNTHTYSEPDVGHNTGHIAVHNATTATSTHPETGTDTWTQTWAGTGTVAETQTASQAEKQTETVAGTVTGTRTTERIGTLDHRFQSRASDVYTFDKTPDYMRSEVVVCVSV